MRGTRRLCRLFGPVLVIAGTALPGPLAAQDTPRPCDTLRNADLRDSCLVIQQAVAESALAAIGRVAATEAPAALAAALDVAIPAAWGQLPTLVGRLLEARFRLGLLRHNIALAIVRRDTSVHGIVPVESRFRPDRGGHGLVMMTTTYSHAALSPVTNFYSPMRDERRSADPPLLLPGNTWPHGWLQGWAFAPGDLVEYSAVGYYPRVVIAR